ncbi:MAG: helix-turn-helix transcriptional regulator [Chlorobiaceae bacterium]|nr:helix-turn-helix transcriptional regulator [Chlorobiaceae bacterium]
MEQEKIGHRIKQLRCEKGLSQDELARQVDLPRTAITKIESGSQDVRFKELEKLSGALGISIGTLVEERRPVRQSADEEFFRVCEATAPSLSATDYRKLRTVLLIILERCAGNPEMDIQRLAHIVSHADRISMQAYGETVSGLPHPTPSIQQAVSKALVAMESDGKLTVIEGQGKQKRHLAVEKADLRTLSAAEYVAIEQAICLASTAS